MKNTRKKMLLSSVAMLLVALVALGSATFAWYFTNQKVTASTTKLKASAADGLVIRKTKDDSWATEITNLKQFEDSNVSPATIDYTKGFGTVTGIIGAKGKSNADGTYTEAGSTVENGNIASSTNAFLVDDFYVATPSAKAKENVQLTIKGSANENTYINVAVYVDDVLIGVVCSDGTTAQTNNRVDILAGNESSTYTLGTLNTPLSKTFSVSTNADNADGSHVQLIAFADGENSKCTTDKANTSEVSFTYEFNA